MKGGVQIMKHQRTLSIALWEELREAHELLKLRSCLDKLPSCKRISHDLRLIDEWFQTTTITTHEKLVEQPNSSDKVRELHCEDSKLVEQGAFSSKLSDAWSDRQADFDPK
jgi:hypothetical protein